MTRPHTTQETTMASIYDTTDGETLSGGLRGCSTCAEALGAAQRWAERLDKDVLLEDDDGDWVVHPDGSADPVEIDSDGVAVPVESAGVAS